LLLEVIVFSSGGEKAGFRFEPGRERVFGIPCTGFLRLPIGLKKKGKHIKVRRREIPDDSPHHTGGLKRENPSRKGGVLVEGRRGGSRNSLSRMPDGKGAGNSR